MVGEGIKTLNEWTLRALATRTKNNQPIKHLVTCCLYIQGKKSSEIPPLDLFSSYYCAIKGLKHQSQEFSGFLAWHGRLKSQLLADVAPDKRSSPLQFTSKKKSFFNLACRYTERNCRTRKSNHKENINLPIAVHRENMITV